jgi:hypothetical protein
MLCKQHPSHRKETLVARKADVDEFDDLDLEEDFDVEEEEEVKATKKGKSGSKKSDTPKGIGARAMAEHLNAEPKTFRAWLRRKIEAGDLPELAEREAKSRYEFGSTLNSPVAKKIAKLWGEDSHERGEGLKKAQEANKKKAAAKKKPAAKSKAKAKSS